MGASPRDAVTAVEADPSLPAGADERFAGYGVMGLPFASGHYLALRRFPAASIGPGYTSVWHRSPDGRWTMAADTTADRSCARYFGSAVDDAPEAPVHIEWTGPAVFTVTVPGALEWHVELGRTAATAAMSAVGGVLPGVLWRSDAVLGAMARAAGPLLGVGRVGLRGVVPNGHRFRASPRWLWAVTASRAVVGGDDVGPPGPLPVQQRLGDFWLPQRGIFAIGETSMDPTGAMRG